jgi:DNA (cytosine-5)-methyltransferase 1
MKFISLFSGIGGFDLGFERAGMQCVAQVEIDQAAQSILSSHWQNVPKFNDVRTFGNEQFARGTIDLICGGFPCQDVSIAGKRAGLAGNRSGLWFEFARIIDELEPRWVVIENVPGLLSSNGGADFAIILQWLVQRGYGVCWRILDAQYFGVPQRRRRVFIVASFGNGSAAQVLFESEGLPGDTPPSREAGEISATLAASGAGTDRPAGQGNELDFCIPVSDNCLTPWDHETKRIHSANGIMATLAGSDGKGGQRMPYVAFQQNLRDEVRLMGGDGRYVGALQAQAGMKQQTYIASVAPTLEAEYFTKRYSNQQFFSQNGDAFPVMPVSVRRFTPTECERLQGFPDGWTSGQSDTQRYKQLGNAVAVPVIEWIGKRIAEVQNEL